MTTIKFHQKKSTLPPIRGDKVELQLFTTLKCNLRCSYCAVSEALGSQRNTSYSIEELALFIDTHLSDKEVYFTFFGGEPLLNQPFIESVMNRFPNSKFQFQTNGTLLATVPPELISRITSFLISLDGGEEITNSYRGKDVFARVMKNVEHIRPYTKGMLTARMTWCDSKTTFEEMDALLNSFDQVHFQFAQSTSGYSAEDIIQKKLIIDKMVDKFYSYDGVYKFVPLMGIARNMAVPGAAAAQCAGQTQCRVSTNLLNIRPDGKIFGCPDMTTLEEMEHGSVKENRLSRNPLQMHPDMPCNSCEAKEWCRGNCMKNLYTAYVMKDEAYRVGCVDPVCELVKYMGKKMAEGDPVGWFNKLSTEDQRFVTSAPIYDYVEIIP
jgi:uncharacterized protein